MSKYRPTHEVMTTLPDNRYVRAVTDGEDYGIEFFNGEKRTRCKISREAMQALVNGLQVLAAGRGDAIQYEWRLIASRPLTFSQEEART